MTLTERDPLLGGRSSGGPTVCPRRGYGIQNSVSHPKRQGKSSKPPSGWRFDGSWIPVRYQMSLLCCWGLANGMGLRVILNIAMVSMVRFTEEKTWNPTHTCPGAHDQETIITGDAAANSTNISTSVNAVSKTGEFDWNESTQAVLIGAYFYGYPILQVPGGYLAERFGAKIIFGVSVFMCAVFTLLTPLAAHWHPSALITARVLMGLLSGPMYPSHHVLWSKWAPPLERGKLMGFAFAGAAVGPLVMEAMTGWLANYAFLGGWPAAFYIFGLVTCVWFCLWMFLVSESPSTNPWITQEEKEYIEAATNNIDETKPGNLSWSSLLTSGPVWALVISMFGDGVIIYALLNCAPLFFQQLFHLPSQQNGMVNALASALPIPFTYLGGMSADGMLARGVSTGKTRKILTFFALGISSAVLALLGLVECNLWATVTLMSLVLSLNALKTGGMFINQLDIAPLYAGTVFGFGNAVSNVAGFIMPMMQAGITGGQPSPVGWRNFFFVAAGLGMFTALMFVIFGSGEEQEWASEKRAGKNNDDEEQGKDDVVDKKDMNANVDEHKQDKEYLIDRYFEEIMLCDDETFPDTAVET